MLFTCPIVYDVVPHHWISVPCYNQSIYAMGEDCFFWQVSMMLIEVATFLWFLAWYFHHCHLLFWWIPLPCWFIWNVLEAAISCCYIVGSGTCSQLLLSYLMVICALLSLCTVNWRLITLLCWHPHFLSLSPIMGCAPEAISFWSGSGRKGVLPLNGGKHFIFNTTNIFSHC